MTGDIGFKLIIVLITIPRQNVLVRAKVLGLLVFFGKIMLVRSGKVSLKLGP